MSSRSARMRPATSSMFGSMASDLLRCRTALFWKSRFIVGQTGRDGAKSTENLRARPDAAPARTRNGPAQSSQYGDACSTELKAGSHAQRPAPRAPFGLRAGGVPGISVVPVVRAARIVRAHEPHGEVGVGEPSESLVEMQLFPAMGARRKRDPSSVLRNAFTTASFSMRVTVQVAYASVPPGFTWEASARSMATC